MDVVLSVLLWPMKSKPINRGRYWLAGVATEACCDLPEMRSKVAIMAKMSRRPPTDENIGRLRETVRALSWLADTDPPCSPFDKTALDEAGQRGAVIVHLAAMHEVCGLVDELINLTVTVAGETGATAPAVGQSTGRSRQTGPDVGKLRIGVTGEKLTMVMSGRADDLVALDCWSSEDPADEALLIKAEHAQVLEVQGEGGPWWDQDVELVTAAMRAGGGHA